MAKIVSKNKNLIRNLLILAVLVIVGFFIWRALFKRGSTFEGAGGEPDLDEEEIPQPNKDGLCPGMWAPVKNRDGTIECVLPET